MQRTDPRIADLVQSGQFRLALFLPQYEKNAASGEVRGIGMGLVGMELGRELAARLGMALQLVEMPTPAKAVDGLKADACDAAFLGIEPSRAAEIDFSPPVIHFDYTFLVPTGSAIERCSDADRNGRRIAVIRHHASTMALRRIVKHATFAETDVPDQALDLLRSGNAEAVAAPREHLVEFSSTLPGSRVLADSYGVNRVAMAIRKGGGGRLAYLSEFLEEAKASGAVGRIIAQGALHGFQVAPPHKAD